MFNSILIKHQPHKNVHCKQVNTNTNSANTNQHLGLVEFDKTVQVSVGVCLEIVDISVVFFRITKQLMEQDGPDWREKLPEIPNVPISAQQHRREEPSADVLHARAVRAEEEKGWSSKTPASSFKHRYSPSFIMKPPPSLSNHNILHTVSSRTSHQTPECFIIHHEAPQFII